MVDFTPSDVSFYEHDKRTFLVLDKEDPERKVSNWVLSLLEAQNERPISFKSNLFYFPQLYYTVDFGDSFNVLQSHVKSFAWSSSGDGSVPVHLYVERKEPSSKLHTPQAARRTEIQF